MPLEGVTPTAELTDDEAAALHVFVSAKVKAMLDYDRESRKIWLEYGASQVGPWPNVALLNPKAPR